MTSRFDRLTNIWPAEGNGWMQTSSPMAFTRSIAEMLLGGTTCFSDMYFFPRAAARVVNERHQSADYLPAAGLPQPLGGGYR